MIKLNIQLFATHKGGGSTSNGRDSIGRRLGSKIGDGQLATGGSIIFKQRGTKILPGKNVKKGKDDTLYTTVTGVVKYERVGKTKTQVSCYPKEA